MPQVLTALEVTPHFGHHFLVELASDEVELDAWGIPVFKGFKIIDVVVVGPTSEAIKQLIFDIDQLKCYSIVDCWQPEDGDCSF